MTIESIGEKHHVNPVKVQLKFGELWQCKKIIRLNSYDVWILPVNLALLESNEGEQKRKETGVQRLRVTCTILLMNFILWGWRCVIASAAHYFLAHWAQGIVFSGPTVWSLRAGDGNYNRAWSLLKVWRQKYFQIAVPVTIRKGLLNYAAMFTVFHTLLRNMKSALGSPCHENFRSVCKSSTKQLMFSILLLLGLVFLGKCNVCQYKSTLIKWCMCYFICVWWRTKGKPHCNPRR